MRRKYLLLVFLLPCLGIQAQEFRSFDGIGNNEANPDWGSQNTNVLRITSNGYEDFMNVPASTELPNPRYVSNLLFNQPASISNALNLSDFWWVWGQFVDHDIILSPDNNEYFPIPVPMGDEMFDPDSTGTVQIPMFRSLYDSLTGTSAENPRNQINGNTSWLDAGMIYGSNTARASWLRTEVNGKLRMSAGNLLPYNTTTGELSDPIDPSAPGMANANPLIQKYFVAGDVRANEQPLLTILHTIFAREHNRLCAETTLVHPGWSDEQIYQEAREKVIALIQKITYEDWLPAAGIGLTPFSTYQNDVDPAISNEFAAAAFRLGHTLINDSLKQINNDGTDYGNGSVALRDAFFNPTLITPAGALESLLKGAAIQPQQELDVKLIAGLRNFMFGIPGAGGLDLASLNIQRGRDRGLADYNSMRAEMGLGACTTFQDITTNPADYEMLDSIYFDIDHIDAWVGMLAEDHMPGMAFGPTLNYFITEQFQRLRDGDRYFYSINPGITAAELLEIHSTNLADILRRNTSIENIQNNLFFALPHTPCELSEIYGCVACYAGGYPEPKNLESQQFANGVLLKWDAVPGSEVCQIKGGVVGGNEVTLLVWGVEPSGRFVSNGNLNSGALYQWKVRCACDLNPLIAGDFSDYTFFLHDSPGAQTYDENDIVANEKNLFIDEVKIGPNPFDDFILITLTGDGYYTPFIDMYDATGRKVYSEKLNSTQTFIEGASFDPGLYIYQIRDGDILIASGKLIAR